jgi:uncharacterized protein
MTEQEQQLISGLAERIRNAPQQQVDRDADDLIRRTIGSRPDALYILTQTVLIQEVALKQANAQLDQINRAPQQPANFLPGQQQAPYYQQSGYAAPPPPPQGGGLFGGGGFGSFLRNAATTAAGVVAGEVAFDTIASMFGHHGGGGFFGGGGLGISPGSETIVNNYYGDDQGIRGDGGDGNDTRFADAASQDQDISPDIEDDRDNSGDGFVDDGSSFDSGGDGGSSDV